MFRTPASLVLVHAIQACTPVPPEAKVLVAPNSVDTLDGSFHLLLEAVPQPYVAGRNSVLMVMVESEGEVDSTASMTVQPWMPDHDHGISPGPTVTVAEDGRLQADWMFSMPGRWELTLDIDGAAGSDTVVVAYDVD